GFALAPSTTAMTVRKDAVREGTFLESDLVIAAFYVVAAPSIDVAVEIAKLHPAARDGGIEVRPLFVPAGRVQDDYAD
ncbi:MAG TPA: YciI family protein, partial [Coriobacteriia bacterium]|nr:YciI family protein [Coriobacteriia bacterium]